jgi:hypothetical protein
MAFYQNEVRPLARRIASEKWETDEICFEAENTILILSKMDNEWTFMLPYWDSEYFTRIEPAFR